MRVRVRLEDGGDGGDLLRWLRSDPVAAHTELGVLPAGHGRSEMGVADVVQAVLDDVSGLGSLVVAVAAWRDARRQGRGRAAAPTVQIQYGGVTVEVTDGSPAEVRRIVDALTASARGAAAEDASGS
jgi:Effector Associated Constant Component 1